MKKGFIFSFQHFIRPGLEFSVSGHYQLQKGNFLLKSFQKVIIKYRVFIMNCVFPIRCNPSPGCRGPAHPCQRPECTVTPIGWPFSEQPITVQFWRGRGCKILKILGKKPQYLVNTLYLQGILMTQINMERPLECLAKNDERVGVFIFFVL